MARLLSRPVLLYYSILPFPCLLSPRVLTRVRSELVVEAWNSPANGAIRINHSGLEVVTKRANDAIKRYEMFACPSKKMSSKNMKRLRACRSPDSFVKIKISSIRKLSRKYQGEYNQRGGIRNSDSKHFRPKNMYFVLEFQAVDWPKISWNQNSGYLHTSEYWSSM